MFKVVFCLPQYDSSDLWPLERHKNTKILIKMQSVMEPKVFTSPTDYYHYQNVHTSVLFVAESVNHPFCGYFTIRRKVQKFWFFVAHDQSWLGQFVLALFGVFGVYGLKKNIGLNTSQFALQMMSKGVTISTNTRKTISRVIPSNVSWRVWNDHLWSDPTSPLYMQINMYMW